MNGIVYIAYQSDPYEGPDRHSGVYTDFDLCLAILSEWKKKSDKRNDQSRLVNTYPYDIFSIVAYSLDCEGSGKTVYEVQGDVVEVDEKP